MTLFIQWHREAHKQAYEPPYPNAGPEDLAKGVTRTAALESAVADLQRAFGAWQVPWHEYVRLQRITGEETYSDARPSLPTAGAEPFLGIVFAFGTEIVKGQRHRYGDFGDSYVSVVEFAPEVKARSILVFGESGDPKSPHYFDQAPLYAQGQFKTGLVYAFGNQGTLGTCLSPWRALEWFSPERLTASLAESQG